MLQLLNQARTNPPAAAQQITSNLSPQVMATLNYYGVNLASAKQAIASATPQPPLAWNGALAVSSQSHSQDMANTKVQSHTGSDGSSPQARMQQAGYGGMASDAENAYAYASSIDQAMQAFLIDWGVANDGHRVNIQQPGVSAPNSYRDVGIGVVQTNNNSFGPLVVTQDFASRPSALAQVVGVAYYDNSPTHFYQPGEGQGGVQIDAVNLQTGQVLSTQTWDSGGYSLPLPAGQYRVIASINDEVVQSVNITVGTVNVEQDITLSNPWQGGTRESAIAAVQAPPSPQPVVAQPVYSQPYTVGGIVPLPASTQPAAPAAPSGMWMWSTWNAKVQ
jgi:uncharacterized protein YkwD